MASSNGFIRLYRKMTDWEWFTDYKVLVVFLHLLLMANWKPGRFQGHDVPAGACVTSIRHLSERTGLSIKSVRTAIEKLKSTNEIGIETANKFTMIFIKNWAKYQGDEPTIGKQTANQRQTKGTRNGKQTATIEEYKNKEYKNSYKKRGFEEREVKDEDFADMFLDLTKEIQV